MSLDATARTITAVALGAVLVVLLVILFAPADSRGFRPSVAQRLLAAGGLSALVGVGLLRSPRAVRVEADAVIVERRGWSELRVPLAEVMSAEDGPVITSLGGDVWPSVGASRGVLGVFGLCRVRNVGLVHCWAGRFGAPTVLLWRRQGLPVLLGVDDAPGLLEALRAPSRPSSTSVAAPS
jgi:hypothetical protein